MSVQPTKFVFEKFHVNIERDSIYLTVFCYLLNQILKAKRFTKVFQSSLLRYIQDLLLKLTNKSLLESCDTRLRKKVDMKRTGTVAFFVTCDTKFFQLKINVEQK